jgi:ferredoxin-NADP reductase
LLDGGEVSPFFHQIVSVGDEVELRGPLGGHFTWAPADGGPLLLMGGGSGVVPLMSMVRQGQASAAGPPTVLLLSARRYDEVLFRDELLALDRDRSSMRLMLTLTREPPRQRGEHGRRVDAAMVAEALSHLPAPPKYVYICGSSPFVGAAADGAVDSGVTPAIIRTERYGL